MGLVPIDPEIEILEIGPGLGALTGLLIQRHSVVAVELDHLFAERLIEQFIPPVPNGLKVLSKDILKCDLSKAPFCAKKLFIVGNLPYQISSQIIFWLLSNRKFFEGAILMLQSEMAIRLCADPGTKNYAPMTILSNLVFTLKKCFAVSPNVFYPKPKVKSTVISLLPRELVGIRESDLSSFGDFLKNCFHARRKTLLNNLKALDFPLDQWPVVFAREGFNPSIRAEALTSRQLLNLFHVIKGGC